MAEINSQSCRPTAVLGFIIPVTYVLIHQSSGLENLGSASHNPIRSPQHATGRASVFYNSFLKPVTLFIRNKSFYGYP
jgi:hypothetical protein